MRKMTLAILTMLLLVSNASPALSSGTTNATKPTSEFPGRRVGGGSR